MTKHQATLAKHTERAMHCAGKNCLLYENQHCTVFENDLESICSKNDNTGKKKLAEFAPRYRFRLSLYRKGLFAISCGNGHRRRMRSEIVGKSSGDSKKESK